MTTSNKIPDPLQTRISTLLSDLADMMDVDNPYKGVSREILVNKFAESMRRNGLAFATFIPEVRKNVGHE